MLQNAELSPSLAKFLQTAYSHQEAGELQQAEMLYQLVLQAKPNHAQTSLLYAKLLASCQQFDQAAAILEHSMQSNPAIIEIPLALTQVRIGQGKLDLAAVVANALVKSRPGSEDAILAACRIDMQRGLCSDAIQRNKRACLQFPTNIPLKRALAEALLQDGQLSEAAAVLEELRPVSQEDVDFHLMVGYAYSMQAKHSEAETAFRRALILEPNCIDAYINLGSTLLCDPTRLNEAGEALEHARALNPKDAQVHSNLGVAYSLQGKNLAAFDSFREAVELDKTAAPAYSNLLFLMQHIPTFSEEEIFREHLKFAERFEKALRKEWRPHANSRIKDRKLKLGYVSGDFRDHAVAYYILPILENVDRSRFNIYCYYTHPSVDEKTMAIKRHADRWQECAGIGDEELSELIRADEIDILVDLSGHTSGNRLLTFARKPAPVQITWIGYAGTTGLEAMDYRITDIYLDPPGLSEKFHTEKLLRLNQTAAVFLPHSPSPEVVDLPALATDHFMFASLNSPKKLTESSLAVWSEILDRVPKSKLTLCDASDAASVARISSYFAAAGISTDRLIFAPWLPIGDFLALLGQIDLALDPFPYNGSTTTFHALWMGVPVVSLAGTRTVSRCGATVLSTVGLEKFAVETLEDYVNTAIYWTQHLAELSALRKVLRQRLQNHTASSKILVPAAVEQAYLAAWHDYCDRVQIEK